MIFKKQIGVRSLLSVYIRIVVPADPHEARRA